MKNLKLFLLTLPDSPYKILDVDFNADSKSVNKAMRALFRRDPRNGAKLGNKAQKMLTDLNERLKVDAFCCEVKAPKIDFAALDVALDENGDHIFCPAFENLFSFSDAQAGKVINSGIDTNENFGEIPFRTEYVTFNRED